MPIEPRADGGASGPVEAVSGPVVILGLGATGLSCARFLAARGVPISVCDTRRAPPRLEALRQLLPDVPVHLGGIDEACMAYLYDEIGRVVGLPVVMGGIPLDTLGATGFGLAIAAEVAEELEYVKLDGAKVVIQGFGAVGTHGARFLADRGAVIVAVSDSRGGIVNDQGLDLDKLLAWKAEGHPVREFAGGTAVFHDELITHPCDIWVPAARPDVFTADNAGDVEAKVVLPGANIAVTAAAEERARRRTEQSGRPYDEVLADIAGRDRIDSSREDSPLVEAAGATVVDTTGMSVDEVVDHIAALFAEATAS